LIVRDESQIFFSWMVFFHKTRSVDQSPTFKSTRTVNILAVHERDEKIKNLPAALPRVSREKKWSWWQPEKLSVAPSP
jgi:hypothetical protein